MSIVELFVKFNMGWCCRELGLVDGGEGKIDVILGGWGVFNLY